MTHDLEGEMEPVDYVVMEWPGRQPDGHPRAGPILDLVDRGIIRVLDVALLVKAEDGSVAAIEIGELEGCGFAVFEGASSGLIGQDDLEEAAQALDPDQAAVLVWENRWAAPVAVALRRSGGQLVASGRIEIQAILAALELSGTGRGRRGHPHELTDRRHTKCPDCFAASPARRRSPARPPPSATACHGARRSLGRRTPQPPPTRAAARAAPPAPPVDP